MNKTLDQGPYRKQVLDPIDPIWISHSCREGPEMQGL